MKKPRIYVQLGRAGDILNILPLCRRDYLTSGVKPQLMVCREYLSMLEGCSYVEGIGWNGLFEDVARASMIAGIEAHNSGREMVCTQIYGHNFASAQVCWSFMRESWACVPDAPPWGSLPLVFDQRDLDREESVKTQLLRQCKFPGRPYIVLAIEGTSSPFPHGQELKKELRSNADAIGTNIVDVSGFLAPHFFDLLGLLEGAEGLVTIDSGLLHLAHAVPTLPVVALITREPDLWHGSPWRPQQAYRFFYDQFPEILPDVVEAAFKGRHQLPTIYHVWSHWGQRSLSETTRRRMSLACSTWNNEAQTTGIWRDCEFKWEDARRNSSNVGDDVPMAYVRDMIEHAVKRDPLGIVALTNADVCFVPGITGQILDRVEHDGACFTHRFDFGRLDAPLLTETMCSRGMWVAGSDAFFFSAEWWRHHGWECGDFIIGREQWDEVFRQLIKRHGGREIPRAIYHEAHASHWLRDHEKNKGNIHNRRIAHQWFLRTGYATWDCGWWRLPGTDGP
jgi:hypothetical protein